MRNRTHSCGDVKKPATEAIVDSAALRLAAIVDSSEDAIVSKDLNGVVQTWNRAAERMFGYTAFEIVGRPISMIIPKERLAEEDEVLARVRAGRSIDHFETVRQRKDGSLIEISLTVSPIREMPAGPSLAPPRSRATSRSSAASRDRPKKPIV